MTVIDILVYGHFYFRLGGPAIILLQGAAHLQYDPFRLTKPLASDDNVSFSTAEMTNLVLLFIFV